MRSAELQSTASNPVAQRSPWHSPVPYLFGGLAAMLGLIAFALLILACSYWKLSGYLENSGDNERDLEAGEDGNGNDSKGGVKMAPSVFEEKFLVIMAGHEKPTFLATPISSRASSFGSNSTTCSCSTESTEKSEAENEEKKENSPSELQMSSIETHDTADHQKAKWKKKRKKSRGKKKKNAAAEAARLDRLRIIL